MWVNPRYLTPTLSLWKKPGPRDGLFPTRGAHRATALEEISGTETLGLADPDGHTGTKALGQPDERGTGPRELLF